MIALTVVVVWLTCGVIAAGLDFAFFQRAFPTLAERDRRKDAITALTMCIPLGPLSLIASARVSGLRYGWSWPSFRAIRYEGRMRALARATGLDADERSRGGGAR